MKKITLAFITVVAAVLFAVPVFAGTWEQDANGWRYRISENDMISDYEYAITNGSYFHKKATEYPELVNKYAVGANIESGGELYHVNANGYMATNAWYFDGEKIYIYFGADGIASKFENIAAPSEYKGTMVKSVYGIAGKDQIPTIRQINDGCKLIHIVDMDNYINTNNPKPNTNSSGSVKKYNDSRTANKEEINRNCFLRMGDGGKRMYRDENGSIPKNCWFWISGSQMPEKDANIVTDDWLCYCFDENGILYRNCTTPDGYTVNDYGQQVVNGVIQRKSLTEYPQRPASIPITKASTTSYKDATGNTPKNCWYWISGKSGNDPVSKAHQNYWLCYCFDENGAIYKNCKTPDGYYVNEYGQWVINGAVQAKSMSEYPQRPASMPVGSSAQYVPYKEFDY